MALIIFLVSGLIIYSVRALEINSLSGAIAEQIETNIPNIQINGDSALLDLSKAIGNINDELISLGSPSNYSPLDGLLAANETLPKGADFAISEVEITDTKITIKGKADRYQAIDRIEQAFKKERHIFCRTERPDTSSRGGKDIKFSITLKMCK